MDYEMDNEMDNEILKLILDESLSDEELRNKLGQYHESDIAEVVSPALIID